MQSLKGLARFVPLFWDHVRKTTPLDILLWELYQNPIVLEWENIKMLAEDTCILSFWSFFVLKWLDFDKVLTVKWKGIILLTVHDPTKSALTKRNQIIWEFCRLGSRVTVVLEVSWYHVLQVSFYSGKTCINNNNNILLFYSNYNFV